jgi:threonine dehydrogenase-like Zn-dependent dehydrogenase
MADLVVDCTGNEQGVAAAFQIARKCGRVVLGGQLKKKMSSFDVDRIIGNFLTVRGMRGHSYQAVELAMQLINRNAHNIRDMASRVFGLAETDLAIRTIAGKTPEPALHCSVDPWR